ncbi:nuclear body protein SP140-like [Trichomycterus rosablanca]|uniref:nuclear body protein SP140-like n=1 Tax=Trichomycterus rosablanca TaxID=2290929 RepID=UPI002F361122
MDPLDFLTDEELSDLFHCKKTEISCMEEPQAFLNQLRDYNLLPEDLYQKVMKMKSKERRQKGVYQILDQLEKKGGHRYRLFWRCVFKDHILQKYTVLRLLQSSLIESVQKEEKTGEEMKRGLKRKKSFEKTDEEKPGPSTRSTSQQKKPGKNSSIFREGEKQDGWSSIRLKKQLPVTCGNKKGRLYKEKLARGDKCILSEGCWFTPGDFEKHAGKGSSRNWKYSICYNIPLLNLIKEGYLEALPKTGVQKDQKVQFTDITTENYSPSGSSRPLLISDVEPVELSDDDQDEEGKEKIRLQEEEEEEEESEPADLSMFEAPSLPVSCGSISGVLYKSRFTGKNSKSIRTEERWFTPEEFVNQESTLSDVHCRIDILCHGKTLHFLVKKKILVVHSLLCPCDRCHDEEPDNDDICFICNSEGDLVCCDECPRAFHDNCHLPNLQKETLGDKWICTYCVLKAYQGLWLPMTQMEALNRPLSGNIMRCEYLLLCLYKEDHQRVFTEDPTAKVEEYSRVISRPMWLDRVKTKLQNKEYKTVGEFVNDVKLIFQNCSKFNMHNEFGRMGSRMSEIFEQHFHKVFNITLSSLL